MRISDWSSDVCSSDLEPKPIGHMIEIRNIAEEMLGRGHDYRARVIQNFEEKASAETAALLEVPVGTKIFHSIIVHHEAEFPIQLEERFVLAAAAPDYGTLDFTQLTPNEYLTRTAPPGREIGRASCRERVWQYV